MWSTKILRYSITKRFLNQLEMSTRSFAQVTQKAYINGTWVNAIDQKTFDVMNPADNSIFGTVPNMNVADVEKAIEGAYNAFYRWQELPAKERSHYLRKWFNLMTLRSEELARVMTLESGKPLREAKGEVAYGNSYVEFYAEEARRINGEILQSPTKTNQMFLMRQPIGVVGLITPWNFPHAMLARKAAAALAAGCTCVIKPAEDTPLTALAMAKLAEEAGIPNGVLNVVTCDRDNAPNVGKLLCTSPQIAGISFTGSTEVGKILYANCAPGIKRIGLELGGNAPFIVFPTANVDHAVKGAVQSKFRNCGQTCVSSNRFFVHASVHDEFVEKFKKEIEKLVVGFGLQKEVTIGPLINLQQSRKVEDFVSDAIAKGAKLVVGGSTLSDLGPLYFQPTLLTNITCDMKVYKEEVFGPVAVIMCFETEEEVMKLANDTPRGLAGYFYSQDIAQIFRVTKHLECGMVGVNEGMISAAEAAFGGIKESGLGREGSEHGIDEYVYIKYMCLGNLF